MSVRYLLSAILLAACSAEGVEDAADVQPTDAATGVALDAGGHDAAVRDASPPDSELTDSTALDAALVDALFDAATDALPVDAGPDVSPLVDAAPDVSRPDMGPPREHCFNEEDDDGDERVDCADPDCRGDANCFFAPEDCQNEVDDNGDDWVDCDDVMCLDAPECALPPEVEPLTTEQIQAVFEEHCDPCHTEQGRADLDLTPSFVEDTVGVPSGQIDMLRITPGDRDESYLFHKIRYGMHDVFGGGAGMPPERPLRAETVERIARWIDALPQ